MWPDAEDVKNVLNKLASTPRPNPEDIWGTVVFTRGFFDFAKHKCWNHGRHDFVSASYLREQAERILGKSISPLEICIALIMMGPLKTNHSVSVPKFKTLKVKFPPIDRFESDQWVLDRWKEQLVELERQIAQEREEVARRRQMFQKA